MQENKKFIEFTDKELDMILKYQEFSEATTIQNAIMNAISLALDHAEVDDGR